MQLTKAVLYHEKSFHAYVLYNILSSKLNVLRYFYVTAQQSRGFRILKVLQDFNIITHEHKSRIKKVF